MGRILGVLPKSKMGKVWQNLGRALIMLMAKLKCNIFFPEGEGTEISRVQ